MSAKDSNFKEDDRALPLFKMGKGNSQQKKTIKVRIFTEIISFVLVFMNFLCPSVRPVGDIVIKKNELLPYCPAELVAKHANEYYQVRIPYSPQVRIPYSQQVRVPHRQQVRIPYSQQTRV